MNKSKSDVPAKFKVIIVINSIIINALQCIFEIVRNMKKVKVESACFVIYCDFSVSRKSDTM